MNDDNGGFVSLITPFDDKTFLCFTRGRFDSWRVSFMDADGKMMDSPKDTYFFDYFLSLTEFGNTTQVIFNELKKLSRHITPTCSIELDHLKEEVISVAEKLHIPTDKQLRFEKATMALLAAMIAEEKKENTKLGKKLKMLGLHQVLIGGMQPKLAADWSKGMRWRDILAEYNRLGV